MIIISFEADPIIKFKFNAFEEFRDDWVKGKCLNNSKNTKLSGIKSTFRSYFNMCLEFGMSKCPDEPKTYKLNLLDEALIKSNYIQSTNEWKNLFEKHRAASSDQGKYACELQQPAPLLQMTKRLKKKRASKVTRPSNKVIKKAKYTSKSKR